MACILEWRDRTWQLSRVQTTVYQWCSSWVGPTWHGASCFASQWISASSLCRFWFVKVTRDNGLCSVKSSRTRVIFRDPPVMKPLLKLWHLKKLFSRPWNSFENTLLWQLFEVKIPKRLNNTQHLSIISLKSSAVFCNHWNVTSITWYTQTTSVLCHRRIWFN